MSLLYVASIEQQTAPKARAFQGAKVMINFIQQTSRVDTHAVLEPSCRWQLTFHSVCSPVNVGASVLQRDSACEHRG